MTQHPLSVILFHFELSFFCFTTLSNFNFFLPLSTHTKIVKLQLLTNVGFSYDSISKKINLKSHLTKKDLFDLLTR